MLSEVSTAELLTHLRTYSRARADFLEQLGCAQSCRDPFAEFSEILVAQVLQASMAPSRVQKGYDLVRSSGRRIQVRYLCNPNGQWVNRHVVHFTDEINDYALVVFVELQVESVLIFPRETIWQVCRLLGKRHPNQDSTLQFTERNYETILAEQSRFQTLAMEIYQISAR